MVCSKAGFLTVAFIWVILCCRGGSTYCRALSSILDFYQLDASSIPLSLSSCDNQNHLQILLDVPWGWGEIALGEKHWTKGSLGVAGILVLLR